MKIIIFGSNGMLGRYVESYFKDERYDVVSLTRKDLDVREITQHQLETLLHAKELSDKDVVINCAGIIKQRKDSSDIDFIEVNSIFPIMLSIACKKFNAYLIHPSSDCVFDGYKGMYHEHDQHNPLDIYDKTKSLAESMDATIIRTSIIGEEHGRGLSLVEWVKSNKNKGVNGFTNSMWNGVTCLQFAKICQQIIEKKLYWKGVRHIFSPTSASKYELVKMISEIYDLNVSVNPIQNTIRCDRTLTSLYNECKNFKIPELNIQIQEMKEYGAKF